jgi:hypothetical protein
MIDEIISDEEARRGEKENLMRKIQVNAMVAQLIDNFNAAFNMMEDLVDAEIERFGYNAD